MKLCDDDTCPAPSHDTYSAYHYGCRSEAATDGHRLYNKRRRQRRHQPAFVSSLGAVRRLQALAVLGWRTEDIASRMGGDANRKWISLLLRDERTQVSRTTDVRVREVFAELAMTPGPSKHAAGRARSKGWFPPLAWTSIDDPDERPNLGGDDKHADENVVAAVMAGRLTWDQMTTADQDHLVVTLMRRGWETAAIADRAGTTRAAAYRAYDRSRARERRGAAA